VYRVAGSDQFRSVWLGGMLTSGGYFSWRDNTNFDFEAWAISEPDV
jgi:hypothetical protein